MLRRAAGLVVFSALSAMARDTVIFDNDSGIFGDDGAALVMLLRSPSQIDLRGITVVSGNVWTSQGVGYTAHILDLLKRPGVPLHAGAQDPLVHSASMAREASRRFGKVSYLGAFDEKPGTALPNSGVAYLISEIERQPGSVTLLAAGPLTNVALALRLKPGIEAKLKRIVIMGGNLHVPGNTTAAAEFNFWFDPEAARIVLRSRIPEKVLFALDVCNQIPIRRKEFDELTAVRTPITELISEDLGNRFPGFLKDPKAKSYMWDSLAAAYLIDPALVTRVETQHLDVDTTWGRKYGAVIPLDRAVAPDATPVTVALGVDAPRAWSLARTLLTERE